MRQHRRSFRIPLLFVALIATAATMISLAPAGANSAIHKATRPAAKAAVTRTIALGADIKKAGSQTQQEAITSFEGTTGRKLAFTRDYLLWNAPFPTPYEQWLGARGTMPLISVNPKTMSGGSVSWSAVANAHPGDAVYAQMKAWADEIKAFGYPVYFIYNHEPEASTSAIFGTHTEFTAAWRNFHNVFATEGVTNAKWMWAMTSFAFIVPTSDRRYAWDWYPGDGYVDAIGADAYTAFTCDNPSGVWHPLAYQIAGFLTFGAQHPTKPMWLPEWGVVEDPQQAGRKAQWITDAQGLFKGVAYNQFVGVAYFNETRPGTACDWHISTSTSAQGAYVALAHDSFFSGSAITPPPDTTLPTASITSPVDGSSQSGAITVSASAGDDAGIASVAFLVDGTPLSTDATAPYTASLDTTTLADGSHGLTAVATDISGNATTSAPVSFTANNVGTPPDTTPPTAAITSPADGSTLSGAATVWATATDDVAVASVGFLVDGTLVSTSTVAPYAAAIDTTTLTNGSHTLTAVATDASDNSTTSAAVAITIANLPPAGCPSPPADASELSGNISLESSQSGWTGIYTSTSVNSRVQVTGGSFDGDWALQIAPKAGTTGVAGVNNVSPTWVPGAPGRSTTVGKRYVGYAEVKASVPGQQVSLLVRETTPSGTGISYATTTVTLNDTAWHTISTAYVAKNAGNSIRYSLYGTFTASSQRVLSDCLSLQSTP